MSTEKLVQRGVNDGRPHTKKVCEKPLYTSAPYCMHCGWHKRFHANPHHTHHHHHRDLDIDTDADEEITAADIVEAGVAVAEVVSDLFSDSGDDSGSNDDDDFGGGGGDFGGGGGSSDW